VEWTTRRRTSHRRPRLLTATLLPPSEATPTHLLNRPTVVTHPARLTPQRRPPPTTPTPPLQLAPIIRVGATAAKVFDILSLILFVSHSRTFAQDHALLYPHAIPAKSTAIITHSTLSTFCIGPAVSCRLFCFLTDAVRRAMRSCSSPVVCLIGHSSCETHGLRRQHLGASFLPLIVYLNVELESLR